MEAKGELIKAALGVDDLSIEVSDEDGGSCLPMVQDLRLHSGRQLYKVCTRPLHNQGKETNYRKSNGLPYNPKYAMRVPSLNRFIGMSTKRQGAVLSKLEGSGTHSMKCAPFTACCYTYPNGIEGEAMESESRGFTSLKKAKAYVDTFYADTNSLHFAGAHIEDVMGEWVYEINCE